MKRNLFTLLLFLMMSIASSNATGYQPVFGNDSTYFSVLFGDDYLYRIQKDSILDGYSYKILPFGDMVRITPDNSKMYVRPFTNPYYAYNQKEYLIMDLDLKLGDSFVTNDSVTYYESGYKVGALDTMVVDSVYYLNGLKHIRFDRQIMYTGPNWVSVYYKFEFIEGVGTSAGFNCRPAFYGIYSTFNPPYICYFKDGVKSYSTILFDEYRLQGGCYSYALGINEKKMGNPIQITYDKKSNHLTVKAANNAETDCSITLYSTNGTLLKRVDDAALPASVSLSNLANGVYIVSLKTANRVFNRKIVVNR